MNTHPQAVDASGEVSALHEILAWADGRPLWQREPKDFDVDINATRAIVDQIRARRVGAKASAPTVPTGSTP
jgi:hypothetical protein